uniref:Carboxylic ester hydrolase n=1 Tax=Cynoglossus semilaevis TaxID=244447 RepID=A0A3P8WIF7_CYNSE
PAGEPHPPGLAPGWGPGHERHVVYLFGGAFLLGASNDVEFLGNSLYDGKETADRGGVIVVTVNYRVGTLGFLSTGDARLPGNYGLWDQHAAIAWIRRNIEAFGGHPMNITIFGQSAGAASVSYQVYSRFIQRFIRTNAVWCGPQSWALQKNPMALTKKIARKVGCLRSDTDLMVTCLKMTDPVGLTLAGKIDVLLLLLKNVMDLLELSPVVDGDFIPDEPNCLFHNAAQFDYMAGVNSMDGHIFAGVDVPSINKRNANTTVEQVKGLLTSLTKAKGNAAAESAFNTYSSLWGLAMTGSLPDQALVKKTVSDIETDFLFLVPTQISFVTSRFLFSQTNQHFVFDFHSRLSVTRFPRWVGAEHAEELQYLFGKPFSLPLIYFPRHRDLAGYMISYWTNFAKTG